MSATITAAERLAGIRAVPGAMTRTFVAPEQRIMFVSLNKNACTSLKWMMAGIMGEDLDSFRAGLLPVTGDLDAIQNRPAWKHAPMLYKFDEALREQISPDNGWFVFAVVRDPRVRLFSAWQNKLLLENPGYTHYRDQEWYPRHPVTEQSIVEDFERFVSVLESDPEHRLRTIDAHFRSQAELLMSAYVDYTRVYEIGELKRLVVELEAHLAALGSPAPVHLPRSNDTPLPATAAPFAHGVRERIEKLYAADFELFPHRWNDFSKVEGAPSWTDAELREAELHAAYGRRIGDLRNRAIQFRDQAKQARQRVQRAKQRAEREKQRADALAARLSGSPEPSPATADRARTLARRTVRRLIRRARRVAERHRR